MIEVRELEDDEIKEIILHCEQLLLFCQGPLFCVRSTQSRPQIATAEDRSRYRAWSQSNQRTFAVSEVFAESKSVTAESVKKSVNIEPTRLNV